MSTVTMKSRRSGEDLRTVVANLRTGMTDAQKIANWQRIKDPFKALETLVENWTFIGTDPYYKELSDALYDMAEKCSTRKVKR